MLLDTNILIALFNGEKDADDSLAELAAELMRRYQIKLPDAAIAASALTLKVPLISRDKRLQKIKEMRVIKI